eukprot:5100172-Lingulodinium_polyedra.AAC.1
MFAELPVLEELLEGGYMPRWKQGDNSRRFHTFTRCLPMTQEPPNPTGKSTCAPEALERWAADRWSYSPYQYIEGLLVWKGDSWRCLNANERAQMLGFPKDYLELAELREE